MPFNGAGVYSPPPPPTYPAVAGELIRAADFNTIISDIAAALTNCVTKDNQSTVPTLTLGALVVTGATALGATATVAGEQILTRRYATGEVVLSVASTAPVGTLALDGQTIGSAASGGTARANADTQALFELLWTASDNTLLPIQDAAGAATTRGLTAAADFAANKRMPLPTPQDGDALLLAVSSGVLSRTAGQVINHTHPAAVTDPGHAHTINGDVTNGGNVSTYEILNGVSVFRNVPTQTSATGISVSISDPAGGGTKNKAAGFFLRPYIAL